jgi:hypothetical protein
MQTATRRLVAASVVLLHATSGMASAKDVRVGVVFDGPVASRTIQDIALKEATVIWAAYGVHVNESHGRDCESIDAARLSVRFGNGPERWTAPVLGSIRFLDGVPEPSIVLYPHVVAALLSVTPGHPIVDSEGAFRDLILGRALGRALAHEIGHFLLRSQRHSAAGLMRAFQPAEDLMDPNRHRFELSADDVRRLAVMTSSFPQSSGVLSCGA